MNIKYIKCIVLSKLITRLGMGVSLILTTGCDKLSSRYAVTEEATNSTTDKISATDKQDSETVEKIEYGSCLSLMGIDQAQGEGLMLHEFFRDISSYRKRLIVLYTMNPRTYNEVLKNFINNHRESLYMIDPEYKRTPLEWAVWELDLQQRYAMDLFQELLMCYKEDNNIDAKTRTVYRTLHQIIVLKSTGPELVRLLVNLGVDVNKEDEHGSTLLQKAVQFSPHPSVVQELLDLAADPNKPNKDGYTPLHYAVYLGNYLLTDLLLGRGACAHVKTSSGGNLLHLAAKFSGNPSLFQLLVDQGVNINEKNNDGHIPVEVAWKEGNNSGVQLLLDLSAEVNRNSDRNITQCPFRCSIM